MTQTLSRDWEAQLAKDMFRAARDLLGEGYVTGYYESAASDFIWVAKAYVRDALETTGDAELKSRLGVANTKLRRIEEIIQEES